MKKAKIIVSVMLTLVMVLAMAIPAFAAETQPSITIHRAVEGQTYSIYKMFTLETYNPTTGSYSYTVDDTWKPFVEGDIGKQYFEIKDGYVTLKTGVNTAYDSDDAKAIAKEALKFAKDPANNITAVATLPRTGEGVTEANKYTANVDSLGYYLVDSSLGALCGLTTTKPTAIVNEKNGQPTVTKTVDKATASIGETVDFTTTITVKKGAENYVLHDKMDDTLAFVDGSIKVQVAGTDVDAANYTLNTNPDDKHTFDITFNDAYVLDLAEDTKIVVTYSATLKENAVIAGDGNHNETWLKYGDNNETTHSKTTTKTYLFDLVKTGSNKKVLQGAEFELYDSLTGGNKISLVKESEGKYRVATEAEKTAEGFVSAVIQAGIAQIKGLGNGTYYLEETKQPDGYNKLTGRVSVTIENVNKTAELSADKTTYVVGGVQVINNTGTEFPTTGGIGTTIFYIVGGILLVGAGVVLVVRRRMSAEVKSK